MRKRGRSRDSLSQPDAFKEPECLEMFFRSLMCVKESGFEKEDGLAYGAEPEVARLNNSRMHGTYRYFCYSFAFDFHKGIRLFDCNSLAPFPEIGLFCRPVFSQWV